MAIKTEGEYFAMSMDLSDGHSTYGCARILASLVEDHPDPAVTSANFECVTRTVSADGTFDKVCIKLNTGDMRVATSSNGTKCSATAKAAAAFAA